MLMLTDNTVTCKKCF